MRLLLFVLFLLTGTSAFATSADSLNTIVDLEYKITQKVKAVLQPVDPDAIVVTKVDVRKTTTQIIGTQLTAVDFFSTGDIQKIDDADIDEISVTIRSGLDPFPPEISKIVETVVMGISKKGRVQFMKMDSTTLSAISKNKEYQKSQKESFQKLVDFVEIIAKKFGMGLAVFVGVYALVHLLLTGLSIGFQSRAANKLGNRIANIKVGSSEDSGRGVMPMAQMPDGKGSSSGVPSSISLEGAGKDSPLEQMPVESLRALFADAYWCENDRFAAWVWASLSPHKKVDLLDSWSAFESYVSYLNKLEPEQGRYHLDPYYLKPNDYHQVSNADLLVALKKTNALWFTLSLMRRQSLPLSLRERVELSKLNLKPSELNFEKNPLPHVSSALRKLPVQLEITSLTEQDEEMLMETPDLIPGHMRRQLPSIVWVALLPREEREKYLQKIPAQSLAEVWIGPESALNAIRDVLPEKKKELLGEYLKRVIPHRNSASMKSICNAALDLYSQKEPLTAPVAPETKAA